MGEKRLGQAAPMGEVRVGSRDQNCVVARVLRGERGLEGVVVDGAKVAFDPVSGQIGAPESHVRRDR